LKKLIITIVVIAVIGVIGLWSFKRWAGAQVLPSQDVKTAKVVKGDIELVVEATGEVVSNRDVEIKSKASGTVVTLPYDVAAKVVAFDGKNADKALLVALDPVDEKRHVEQTEAALAAEQARYEQAQTNLKIARANLDSQRMETAAAVDSAAAKSELAAKVAKQQKDLFTRNAATQDEVDNANSAARIAAAELEGAKARQKAMDSVELTIELRQRELDLYKANVDAAKLSLDDARKRLEETQIYCPVNGVVAKSNVQIGTIIASGINNIGGGTTLMTVSDYSHVYIDAEVNESDVGSLLKYGGEGKDVTITVESYPGEQFHGKVVYIAPDAKEEANVISYPVKIEVLDRDRLPLYAKMTAHVKIHAMKHAGALLLPLTAIRYDGDDAYVELSDGDNIRRADVKLGINDNTNVQVLQGVKEGDEVLVGAAATKWSNDGKGKVRPKPAPASGPDKKAG